MGLTDWWRPPRREAWVRFCASGLPHRLLVKVAPYTRSGVLSLVALTLHYSVLSLLLHVSLTRNVSHRYHASSAVVLTELLKILICVVTCFASGELVSRVAELKWERERQEELYDEDLPTSSLPRPQDSARTDCFELTAASADSGSTGHNKLSLQKRRAGHDLKLDPVNSNSSPSRDIQVSPPSPEKRSSLDTPKAAISFAVIPATPSAPVTPMPAPDSSSLHPEMPTMRMYTSAEQVAWTNSLEKQYWAVLIKERVFCGEWWKVGLPACLFVMQANLQYIAARNLSVVVFQLAYQLKIPMTALFSVLLLKRSLSSQQWLSLITLSLGVGLVQLDSSRPPTSTKGVHDESINQTLGLLAVILACCSSGYASTYFERMLKANKATSSPSAPSVSLWVRNIQLSLFGLALALPIAIYQMEPSTWSMTWLETLLDPFDWIERFLVGFDGLTWTVVALQAVGGLLGALVMQHADNIAKCFATSMSVVLSFIISVWLLDFDVTLLVLAGSALVLGSTWVYTAAPTRWRFVFPSLR